MKSHTRAYFEATIETAVKMGVYTLRPGVKVADIFMYNRQPCIKAHFSQADKLLETTQHRRMVREFSAMLEQQFDINVNSLLRGVDLQTLTQDELNNMVTAAMTPGADAVDYDKLLELMLFFSREGVTNGAESLPFDTTATEMLQPRTDAETWTRQRAAALFGVNPPDTTPTGKIDNPALQNSIDVATADSITALLWGIVATAIVDGISKRGISDLFNTAKPERIRNRAQLLGEDNTVTPYGNGQYNTGRAFGPIAKRWLMTESKVPRAIHLQQVGQEVAFDVLFSPSGDFWSQERINCKCGILAIYPATTRPITPTQEQPRGPFDFEAFGGRV